MIEFLQNTIQTASQTSANDEKSLHTELTQSERTR